MSPDWLVSQSLVTFDLVNKICFEEFVLVNPIQRHMVELIIFRLMDVVVYSKSMIRKGWLGVRLQLLLDNLKPLWR